MRGIKSQVLTIGILAAVSASGVTAQITFPLPYKTLDCSKYPKTDTPVAVGNDEFTALVDLTGAPNLPLNTYDVNKPICQQHDNQATGYCNAECGCRVSTEIVKCQNAGHWAPTYDDGPSAFTANVLSTLKDHNDTKATFFVIGSRLCSSAKQMIDAINAGHEIAVHTWAHPRLTSRTNEQIIAEIKWTEKAIFELTGIKPKYMRPPNGNLDNRARYIVEKLGYTPVLWVPDTNDWQYNYIKDPSSSDVKAGTNAIVGNITDYIKSNTAALTGTVSLEHDIAQITVTAAKSVLDNVVAAGWSLVPLTTCAGATSWAQNVVLGGGQVPSGTVGTTVTSTSTFAIPKSTSSSANVVQTNTPNNNSAAAKVDDLLFRAALVALAVVASFSVE